ARDAARHAAGALHGPDVVRVDERDRTGADGRHAQQPRRRGGRMRAWRGQDQREHRDTGDGSRQHLSFHLILRTCNSCRASVYSSRSAVVGLTRAARSAGIHAAIAATSVSTASAARNVPAKPLAARGKAVGTFAAIVAMIAI